MLVMVSKTINSVISEFTAQDVNTADPAAKSFWANTDP